MKTLFKNGTIFSLDNENTTYSSMLIEDGRILALDPINQEVEQVVDLEGHYVYPSLNDSHCHLVGTALIRTRCNVTKTTSLQDMKKRIEDFIENNHLKKGDWIVGRGWNQEEFDQPIMPTKKELDVITSEYPLVLTRACGHLMVVNSLALKKLGMDHPDGIFRESELDSIYDVLPEPSKDQMIQKLQEVATELNQMGITAVQSDDFENLRSYTFEEIIDLIVDAKLNLRVYEQSHFPTLQAYQDFLSKDYRTGYQKSNLTIGPLKLLLDGALGARTAAQRREYHDDPNNTGMLLFDDQTLSEYARLSRENKMHMAFHAIGSRAIDQAITHLNAHCRDAIVHAQCTTADHFQKIKEKDLYCYVQPIFIDSDWKIAESRLGDEYRTSYAWKTMLDYGIHMSFGTDAPVEPFDPWMNLYEAITRCDQHEKPDGGWIPSEKLSVLEALRAYTIESAYASFSEKELGSLEVGKVADFMVLKENLFTTNPHMIKDIKVLATYFEGTLIHPLYFGIK